MIPLNTFLFDGSALQSLHCCTLEESSGCRSDTLIILISVGLAKVFINNMQTAYLTKELSLYFAGMVHRYICIGNLSPEFTASILNTKGRYTTGMRAVHYLLRNPT